MRFVSRLLMSAIALLVVTAAGTPVFADETETQLGSKVVAALKSMANGKCPSDLMGPILLDQCEQQLSAMQERLSSLGTIKEAQYRGVEQLPNGAEAKAYKVIFARGTMMWLAATSSNGKLNVLWSPG